MDAETEKSPRATGSCLCGSVRYTVRGLLRDVAVCHCVFCRRMNTHVGAYASCALSDLEVGPTRTLRWYRASPIARRGFCSKCGTALFWERSGATRVSISAGSLNEPTGLRIYAHLCTAQKGDYYDIADGLPQT